MHHFVIGEALEWSNLNNYLCKGISSRIKLSPDHVKYISTLLGTQQFPIQIDVVMTIFLS